MEIAFRDYQQRVMGAVGDYFECNAGSPLLVLPTGAGKSVVIAGLCRQILETWPNQRILILSHVRELIEQNYQKILAVWPQAPAGLYCAGLGQKRPRDPITVASIQSVYQKAPALGFRDLVFIDEAHLLGGDSDSMYRKLLAGLKEINRKVKVIGLTATPYRTKTGLLTAGPDRLFTDIACEVTLQELLDGGYICPLVSKSSTVQADLSAVRITAGEFNAADLERAMDKEALTNAALDEVFTLAADRKSWLVFCAGVKHAEHVRDAIRARGVSAEAIHGGTPSEERDAAHAAFKAGRLRVIVSVGVHTTGFDAPNVDLIVLLRGTQSPGLYVQMLGRGMRLHPDKQNCLVLDYASNLETHGPVTHVRPPKPSVKRGARPERNTPACRICPKCRMASPLDARECGECGHSFERPEGVKHGTTASTLEVMPISSATQPPAEWVEVDSVRYMRHEKEGKITSMRVEYTCGKMRHSEWVCLAHPPGFALGKARDWWKKRTTLPPPEDIGTAVMMSLGLKKPKRIRVTKKDKWFEVIGYEFEEDAAGTPASDAGRADSAA